MKKLLILLFALSIGVIAGCGTTSNQGAEEQAPAEETAPAEEQVMESETTESEVEDVATVADEHDHGVMPEEPGEGTMCSMCDMIVYHKDHEMGKFTGQVVTADGEYLYTDDVGCLLNQVRVLEEKQEQPLAAWVRDYNTLEWIPADQAIPVRASIETPMKMGFALFGTEEAANKYVTENPMVAPVLSTMDDVDKIALERRKAKMAKMQESQQKMEQQQSNMEGNMEGEMSH
ncbi:nitrous oxide reductase accessory protein NosL [Calidifontibacillus oryziterrae]|uniref:nitrous oxide reductase accessory protein NosL n=1 Tax=Calidifontibacillus oryziterrae TaxID=1191699 RepID=UPI0002E24BD0|nr:nitrous oxide reductase accessory protein NosL [Calidifontibacillus oryziterrae]